MTAVALLAPWLLLVLTGWHRTAARAGLVLAPLPLLALSLGPDHGLVLPELLIGARFGIDAQAGALALLAGAGWFIAGLHAATRTMASRRLALFWQSTLGGQTLALLAGDLASFYLGYVTMTLAAYGLIVHAGSAEAWRAGRIYLVLAFFGEALILSGLLLIGVRFGNAPFDQLPELIGTGGLGAAVPLLFTGFAVKLGIVPLHMWLPLAHPVAPVPASAVLSGVIVKAGLLGWLRFLPAEAFGAAVPGGLLAGIGVMTAFYGVIAGLCQQRLKTVLAYSTISQMGLLLTAHAATLAAGAGGALSGMLVLHHGFNKIALFLAAGCVVGTSRLRAALFALPALSLAGLPLTGGAQAKSALKAVLTEAELGVWSVPLALSSTATLLLMLHAFALARRDHRAAGRIHPAWVLAVVAGLGIPLAWGARAGLPLAISPGQLWEGLWPLLLGAALYSGWQRRRSAAGRSPPALPEGDVLVPLERALGTAGHLLRQAGRALPLPHWRSPALPGRLGWLARLEATLVRLPVSGAALLVTLVLLWLLLWRSA